MPKPTQKGTTKTRSPMLTPSQVVEMIKTWDGTTPEALAEKFGCKATTIATMAASLRKRDSSLCPKKRSSKSSIIDQALKLLKQ